MYLLPVHSTTGKHPTADGAIEGAINCTAVTALPVIHCTGCLSDDLLREVYWHNGAIREKKITSRVDSGPERTHHTQCTHHPCDPSDICRKGCPSKKLVRSITHPPVQCTNYGAYSSNYPLPDRA